MTQKPAIKRKIAITRTRLLPLVLMLIVTPAQAGIPPFPINPPPISDGGGWGGKSPKKHKLIPPPISDEGGWGGEIPKHNNSPPAPPPPPLSFPRKRESRTIPGSFWIPAFAGMTTK